MSLSPAIWGEGYYFWTPVIMLTMIVVPHFYLLKKIIVGLLNCAKSIWIIISSMACFVMIESMFVPVEGLFWYNGAIHYVFMHGCMIMLLLIPFFWKVANTDKFSFRFPAAVTVLSICSNACMLTPGLYAMGISGAGRTLNIVKLWFVLLVFVNEAYWLGYIKKKLFSKLPIPKIDVRIWVCGIFLLVFASFAANVERRGYDYSSYAAYVSLRAGEAQQYHREYMDRVEILTGEESVVELKPFSVKPYLLYFDDITTNIYDWRNAAVARWYGKEQVYLSE